MVFTVDLALIDEGLRGLAGAKDKFGGQNYVSIMNEYGR